MRKFRNVTKKVAAFSLCGIMMLGLAACGAKASNDMAYDSYAPSTESAGGAWNNGMSFDGVIAEDSYDMKVEYEMSESAKVESPVLSAGSGKEDSLVIQQGGTFRLQPACAVGEDNQILLSVDIGKYAVELCDLAGIEKLAVPTGGHGGQPCNLCSKAEGRG